MPLLNRETIAANALELIHEFGIQGFTLTKLAARLHVQPSALYNHVRSKEDIIASARELTSDQIDVSAFGALPWAEAVEAWAYSYRQAFTTHPDTVTMLATMPLAGATRTIRMYEVVTAGFIDAGWPAHEALSALVAVESFILGSALDALAPVDMLEPVGFEHEAPTFAEAFRARADAAGDAVIPDLAFTLGLRALIDGLSARLAQGFTP